MSSGARVGGIQLDGAADCGDGQDVNAEQRRTEGRREGGSGRAGEEGEEFRG